jgi:hypothetical protein
MDYVTTAAAKKLYNSLQNIHFMTVLAGNQEIDRSMIAMRLAAIHLPSECVWNHLWIDSNCRGHNRKHLIS